MSTVLENIYGSESNKLGKVEAEVEIPVGLKEFWSKIYGQHKNNIKQEQNEDKRAYIKERERSMVKTGIELKCQVIGRDQEEQETMETCRENIRQHTEMAFQI